MSPEALSILDSAVKIGLGAAIAALSSIGIALLSRRTDRTRDLRNHRLKTLEVVAEAAEHYFSAVLLWHGRVTWCARNRAKYEAQDGQELRDSLRERDRLLMEASAGTELAVSRLRLLGEMKAADSFIAVKKCVRDLRNPSVAANDFPTDDQFLEFGASYRERKKEFFDELHKAYKKT